MHFSRLAVVALPILGAVASVLPRDGCSGGSLQCCQQVTQTNSLPSDLVQYFNLIGVALSSIAPAVGADCTNIVVGVSQQCQSNTVCCTGNNYQYGLVNLNTGCTPITL